MRINGTNDHATSSTSTAWRATFPATQQPVLRVGLGRSDQGNQDGWSRSEATRYLCASAYLNRAFRDWVIKHYIEDKHTALEVSYGINPTLILKHCLIARKIGVKRDLLLFLPVAILLLATFFSLLLPSLAMPVVILAVATALLTTFAIVSWEQWELEFHTVRRRFTKKHFDPDTSTHHCSAHEEQVFREVDAAQKANTNIYGGFSPFVGSGKTIGSWSVPVDLTKGKEDVVGYLRPTSFEIKELYEEIARTLRDLQLPGCSLEDRLCVSGLDIRGEAVFLPDLMGRPNTLVDRATMEENIKRPSMLSRHYQNFRLVDWSGELILNAFFRAAKNGHHLFLEQSYWLLTPVDAGYRGVDNMNPVPSWRDWVTLLWTCAVRSVFIWFVWPFYIAHLALHPIKAWLEERETQKRIRENPAINFGSFSSLRESTCTSNVYRHYFQQLDKEMYFKTLESQVLSCIVQFLDDHNIDTSDLKEAQTNIINSGIIVAGSGSIGAQSVAAGHGSSAVTNAARCKGAVKFIQNLTGGHS